MQTTIWYETHSTTVDNENGVATGWLPGELSALGRQQAADLGSRIAERAPVAIFGSDLGRTVETVQVAYQGLDVVTPILMDWRLRECDYGELNGSPSGQVHDHRERYLTDPYPGGESWTAAVARAVAAIRDGAARFPDSTIVVVGHIATWMAAMQLAHGTPTEKLIKQEFDWEPGWSFTLQV
jgi:2,3-bisphosphoglycerate-dependent phosphoglycerate mutase